MSDEGRVGFVNDGAGSAVDLSFAAFSLAHAECGEEGVIELRLGDRLLLEWCPACATLKTFRSLASNSGMGSGALLEWGSPGISSFEERVPRPEPR